MMKYVWAIFLLGCASDAEMPAAVPDAGVVGEMLPACEVAGVWDFAFAFDDAQCADFVEGSLTETYDIRFAGGEILVADATGNYPESGQFDPNDCTGYFAFLYTTPETEENYGVTVQFVPSLFFQGNHATAEATFKLDLWEGPSRVGGCATSATGTGNRR